MLRRFCLFSQWRKLGALGGQHTNQGAGKLDKPTPFPWTKMVGEPNRQQQRERTLLPYTEMELHLFT